MNDLEQVTRLGQKCLEGTPVLVVGSGASIPFGVRGMRQLEAVLLEEVKPSAGEANDAWGTFIAALTETKDLELALQHVLLPHDLLRQVVAATRSMILTDDQKAFGRIALGNEEMPLSRVFRHLFRSVHRTVSVVTTNYDRLVEYATEQARYGHFTGFSQGYARYLRTAPVTPSDRIVNVWKVHGSIDWFLDVDRVARALPDYAETPDTFEPLLVTPGLAKYELTHQEPFRTIISQADNAVAQARSLLCVGFGFNDTHIQPKLTDRVRHERVPVVILAKKLTNAAKKLIETCGHHGTVALEESPTGTRAFFGNQTQPIDLPGVSVWQLGPFLDLVLGKE